MDAITIRNKNKEVIDHNYYASSESQRHGRKMLRVLFEDRSSSPYVLDLSREQCDVVLKPTSAKGLDFAVYTPTGMAFMRACEWARVDGVDDWFG